MRIHSIGRQALREASSDDPLKKRGEDFSRVLSDRVSSSMGKAHRLFAGWGIPSGVVPGTACPQRPIFLGTISPKCPTVSHLLVADPHFRKETWHIIHSGINRDKSFKKMRVGEQVYLDPNTREILWGKRLTSPEENTRVATRNPTPIDGSKETSQGDEVFSTRLVEAVEDYVGSPYEKMDCFELVVQGLKKLGVRYHGPGGLCERLVKTALDKGLRPNAYLNGEGLIETSGRKVYSRSIARINPSRDPSRSVFQEMKPFLKRGLILSFSTPTHGHTGVVSQKNGRWTYINSGTMDHEIDHSSPGKGVGEEYLTKEISNWMRLAAQRGERLLITLGSLQEDKLPSIHV